jgi:hypothetical protein
VPVVTGVIRDPAGNGVRGTVTVSLIAGTVADPGYTTDGVILSTTNVAADEDGEWTITLVSNDDIEPTGTYYEVLQRGAGSPLIYRSLINVPDGAGPYALPAILVDAPDPPAAVGIAVTQLGVPGGVATLDVDGFVPLSQLGNVEGGTAATTVVAETTFGLASAVGDDTPYARQDHAHGTPANPVTAHVAASDPHGDRAYTDGALTGLTAANFAAASIDGVAATASLRTLGTAAQQAAAGNHGHAGGAGDVVGPVSSVNNAVARFDGTTGKLLKGSLAIIGDDGSITVIGGRSTTDFVVGTAGARAYRFKVTGGALNLDAAGASLYVGVFSAVDFAGTERTYLRLENGVTLAHAGGRWEFTDNVEDASVHAIDPVTGVAELGAKNSLSNVRVVGRRATPGPPTTGTWVAGDTAQDSRGAWFLCTAGGTPGTWAGSLDMGNGYVSTGDVTLPGSTPWIGAVGLSGFAIPAQVGDRIVIQLSFLAVLQGVNFLDTAVMVGGSPVRFASTGNGTPAIQGDPTAYRDVTGAVIRGMGPFTFVAEAGDISGGNVTFGLVHTGAGTTSTVFAGTNYPFRYQSQNFGPA